MVCLPQGRKIRSRSFQCLRFLAGNMPRPRTNARKHGHNQPNTRTGIALCGHTQALGLHFLINFLEKILCHGLACSCLLAFCLTALCYRLSASAGGIIQVMQAISLMAALLLLYQKTAALPKILMLCLL